MEQPVPRLTNSKLNAVKDWSADKEVVPDTNEGIVKMKIFNFFAFMLVLIAGMGFVTSCSSDDDDDAPSFDTPKYESDAVLLEFNGAGDYKSMELTASGNYIIVSRDYIAKVRSEHSAMNRMMLITPMKWDTRAANIVYGNVIYGSYTKNADGSYNLDGFGVVTVTTDADGDAVVTLTRDGNTQTLHASVVDKKMSGALTDKLCRTWQFAGYRMVMSMRGKTMIDAKGDNMEEFVNNFIEQAKKYGMDTDDVDFDFEDFSNPMNVVFTKNGTYVITYSDGTIGVSFWTWKNEANQTIYYSWDNNFDPEYAGDCQLEFASGGYLYVIEKRSPFDDEDDYYYDDDDDDDDEDEYDDVEIKTYSILKEA